MLAMEVVNVSKSVQRLAGGKAMHVFENVRYLRGLQRKMSTQAYEERHSNK